MVESPDQWSALEAAFAAEGGQQLATLLSELPSGDSARLLSRLDVDRRAKVLAALPAKDVASLLAQFPVPQAADLLRLLPSQHAAEVFQRLPSNDQADLFAALNDEGPQVLADVPPEIILRVRRLLEYPPDSAGGLMVAEYLSYPETARVADIIDDLRANTARYARLDVQYAYIVDRERRLVGVLRLRDLLLLERDEPVRRAMVPDPVRVTPNIRLEELLRIFDRRSFFGLPVVDENDQLIGVIARADVEEAGADRANLRLLMASGVLGGDEFRSMPWRERLMRRAPWLAMSLLLSLSAASVINFYEETVSQILPLVMFLPVISGMGGNSGTQAMAVSIRELSLGLVRSDEFRWVIWKEISVAAVNALCLGCSLALLCLVWHRSPGLSLVVGAAIAMNTIVAACLGGLIPLALKRVNVDPALASGPLMFTTVDFCGYLFTLTLAQGMLSWIKT